MPRTKRREQLLALFHEKAVISRTLGMRLSFDEEDRAVVTLPFNPAFTHPNGIHGGVYATLMDSAGWFASAVRHSDSHWIATSEMSIHFLRAAMNTELKAVGSILKIGKRQDIVEMRLYDGDGELVGHAVGTFLLLPHIPIAE